MVNAIFRRDTDPERRRVAGNSGTASGKTQYVDAACGASTPWHEAAQDRDEWGRMEVGYVARVLRRALDTTLARTRWMMPEAEEAETWTWDS